ncbi:MAG: DUF3108 domain-containing protein [Gemmatimonadota bacterium]|nr:DUF3108 domain-containing protein [Gemmatimonadota bacterium]MDE3215920.1 DUF3108 domain-containing protein [Gemmatimonadota bacterium]
MRRLFPLALFLLANAAAAPAQSPPLAPPPGGPAVDSAGPGNPDAWPFSVGEKMVFDGKFGFLPVARAEVVVEAQDTVRGHQTYRIRFSVNGGPSWFGVHDNYTSWFDDRTLISLRYYQNIREGRYHRNSKFEILPEHGIYIKDGKDTSVTVPAPLDDQAFIYFIRTLPLAVGQHYEWNRYFQVKGNPVIVDVVRRETIEVPAGKFDCFVLRPTIRTTGIFGEGGHAEVWVSADDRRIIVQMKSGLSFGSLNLYLRSYTPGGTPADSTHADTAGRGR